jgi:hypothetical protein
MREISSSITFEVQAGETIPLRVARSTRLSVQGGVVWVTRSDDVDDYFLVAGEGLKLRRGERLWLSSDGKASACVAFTVALPVRQVAVSGVKRALARAAGWFRDDWRTV